MKCLIHKKGAQRAMLFAGLALLAAGGAFAALRGETASALAMRAAGFVTGLGAALTTFGGVGLVWRRAVGEGRAEEEALAQSDERGQLINVRAQAILGFAATAAVVAITLVATVRGDMLYIGLGCAGCFAIAATGIAARAALSRRL